MLDLVPSLITYIVFYFNYYITYPGSGLNYIFATAYQGIDYTIDSIILSLNSIGYEVRSGEDIFNLNLKLSELLPILINIKFLNLIIQSFLLKLSISLGFVHELAFQSENQFWLLKIWRSLYAFLFIISGYYSSILLNLSNLISREEKVIYFCSFLYIVVNSILMGDPRYSLGYYFIFLVALFKVISLIGLNKSSYS